MQVEVNVEDHYSPPVSSEPYDLPANPSCSPDSPQQLLISPAIWSRWFQTWLEVLQPDLSSGQTYELSLRLTDDSEIQQLNAAYRQRNQPTDVLAFAALEANIPQPLENPDPSVYLGDIVISVETADQQAKEDQHSLEYELAWLAAHGLLHLLGWDHPDEAALQEMLNLQKILLQTVDINT